MKTKDEIMKMSEKELLEAICEGMGYQKTPGLELWLPKFTTNHNAVFDLEEMIPEEMRGKYFSCLVSAIVMENPFARLNDTAPKSAWSLLHASAIQRCRAWLMMMEDAS